MTEKLNKWAPPKPLQGTKWDLPKIPPSSSTARSNGGNLRAVQPGTSRFSPVEQPFPPGKWTRVLPTHAPKPDFEPVEPKSSPAPSAAPSLPSFRGSVMLDRATAPHTALPLPTIRPQNGTPGNSSKWTKSLDQRSEGSSSRWIQDRQDGEPWQERRVQDRQYGPERRVQNGEHSQSSNRAQEQEDRDTTTVKAKPRSSDTWGTYVDSLNEDDDGAADVGRKPQKSHFGPKPESRGSLVEKMRIMPSLDHSQQNYRVVREEKTKVRKSKKFVAKQVTPDVYIPSIVSVGQLAQLLDVRLGKLSTQRFWASSSQFHRAITTQNGTIRNGGGNFV